jgi:hypothetical protein
MISGWMKELGNKMGTDLPILNRLQRKEIIVVIICLLIGFALRFYALDQKSLWWDEIYTFNDSRDGLKGQLGFYKENPTFLHPPLFFILTHLFYPFQHPERDLRIIPLIFGTLSIPMIYFLARSFAPPIAIPCTLSLTFMAYHISLSQEGRCYSLIMFLGMASLYFFMKHLRTSKRRYLLGAGIFFAILFYTSYSSIPFIVLSQILWFYKTNELNKKRGLSSFFILNGSILLLCIPWILFVALHYKGQPMMDPHHTEDPGSLWSIIYWILHDWVPHAPLMMSSFILLILFPVLSQLRKNALVLLTFIFLPVAGVYLFCHLLNITHFISSRYFINLMPLFFIAIYFSIHAIELKFERLKRVMRLSLLFVILFTASNFAILPLYYQSQKQDLKGLVLYLKAHLRPGDKIFDGDRIYTPGILHYFGIYPEGRQYVVSFTKDSEKGIEYKKSFTYRNQIFTIYYSNSCCAQYVEDGSRLWIIAGKEGANKMKEDPLFVLKGYFDGSFLNFNRFPADASMYLFLLDLGSPEEKGIDMPIE